MCRLSWYSQKCSLVAAECAWASWWFTKVIECVNGLLRRTGFDQITWEKSKWGRKNNTFDFKYNMRMKSTKSLSVITWCNITLITSFSLLKDRFLQHVFISYSACFVSFLCVCLICTFSQKGLSVKEHVFWTSCSLHAPSWLQFSFCLPFLYQQEEEETDIKLVP